MKTEVMTENISRMFFSPQSKVKQSHNILKSGDKEIRTVRSGIIKFNLEKNLVNKIKIGI